MGTEASGKEGIWMAIPYVCLYASYLESLAPYSDAERGRLFTAMLSYAQTGQEPVFDGNERFLWPTLKSQIDRDAAAYQERREKNQINGRKGGRPKGQTAAEKTERFFSKPKKPKEKEKENEKENEKEKEKEKENENEKENDMENERENEREKESGSGDGAPPPAGADRKAFGTYHWVMLSQEAYHRLLAQMGQAELDRCIAYIDESAQATGNKNHWQDWEVVLRRCHQNGWGRERRAGKPEVPSGASGQLGEAELEAIAMVLREGG